MTPEPSNDLQEMLEAVRLMQEAVADLNDAASQTHERASAAPLSKARPEEYEGQVAALVGQLTAVSHNLGTAVLRLQQFALAREDAGRVMRMAVARAAAPDQQRRSH